jgi:type VI secretion system protein ImpK
MSIDELMGASLNPLVSAAMPLLAAAPRVRHTARHPNPGALKEALADGIRKFEAQARAQGVPNEQVIAGRYILCTFLDESAASTPWGGSGAWSANSLLVLFHNETWGGEKVFQLMGKLAENVQGNRPLLELLYVVLALGFEGRFRVVENGQTQLDAVRERLAGLLRQGQTHEKALSPHWEGAPERAHRLSDGVPVWVLATVTVMVLALLWAGFKLWLSSAADPLFSQLQGLQVRTVQFTATQPPPPPPPPAAKPRLAGLLKPEIAAGLVEVQDLADRSIVTIKGDGFFEPGSTEIAFGVRTLLPRISEALGQLPGQVLVTGHTDNQPIRTLRFPSNWHLSQQRADAVRHELSRTVQSQRLRAEGRADSEPVTDNDGPAGRSRNRRVEITLFNAG